MVITFNRIRKNPSPWDPSRIFDDPSRCAASIGSKRTLYPAFMNASVVVVGVENPLGIRCRNSTRHSRRPEPRREIGNVPFGQIAGERVERGVPEAARETRLSAPRSRADDEIVGG